MITPAGYSGYPDPQVISIGVITRCDRDNDRYHHVSGTAATGGHCGYFAACCARRRQPSKPKPPYSMTAPAAALSDLMSLCSQRQRGQSLCSARSTPARLNPESCALCPVPSARCEGGQRHDGVATPATCRRQRNVRSLLPPLLPSPSSLRTDTSPGAPATGIAGPRESRKWGGVRSYNQGPSNKQSMGC